jgi:hypothetical protein
MIDFMNETDHPSIIFPEAWKRGLKYKRKVMRETLITGGLNTTEAADLLRADYSAIREMRDKDEIFYLPRGKTRFVYPLWQFDTINHQVHPNLVKALNQMKGNDMFDNPWSRVIWMVGHDENFNSPLKSLLIGKEVEWELRKIQRHGEHGAL